MAKFCSNCGTQCEDDAMFCASCGSSLNAPEPEQSAPEQPVSEQPKTKVDELLARVKLDRPKAIMIGAIAAAVLVLIILLTSLFPSPKAVTKKYMSGIKSGNAEAVVNCMPSFLWANDKDKKEDFIDNFEDSFEEMEFEKFTYKITDVEKLEDDEKEDYLEGFEYLEKMLDDFDSDDVTDVRIVKVKVTMKVDGEQETETLELMLIKYKGQWKVMMPMSI